MLVGAVYEVDIEGRRRIALRRAAGYPREKSSEQTLTVFLSTLTVLYRPVTMLVVVDRKDFVLTYQVYKLQPRLDSVLDCSRCSRSHESGRLYAIDIVETPLESGNILRLERRLWYVNVVSLASALCVADSLLARG